MSKSLTNRLYLKKQLLELKINKQIDVRDHINKFNKCIIQLLSIGIRIDEANQVIILLASLTKLHETVVTTLLVGKTILIVDKMSTNKKY